MSTTESLLLAASSSLSQQVDLTEHTGAELLQQLLPQFQFNDSKRFVKPCTTRRRLSYEKERTFTSVDEFRLWWEENEATQWVYNSTYQVKNSNEIQAYRCNVRNCPQRIRIVYGINRTEIRVERSNIGHQHEETIVNPLSSQVKGYIETLEAEGHTANRIRQHLKLLVDHDQMPSLKQIQNFISRLRLKRSFNPPTETAEFDADTLIPRRRRGRPRKQSAQMDVQSSLASLFVDSLLQSFNDKEIGIKDFGVKQEQQTADEGALNMETDMN
ncbi:hypothetical protein M3Y94_01267200 [Aphelenchoides besseyi]|nr:hypothetical protein M3Y94_01267200 [Aphelenchoides besseyi]KAI6222600.1 hypothetical protein M3Y95_00910800 [Aphelenchoides besseyi]